MTTNPVFRRNIEDRIHESQGDTPVTLVTGPRQAGKTTLVKQIVRDQGMQYLTLDDDLTRLSAQEDPVGLIRGKERVAIDEIQRAPQLYWPLKKMWMMIDAQVVFY